MSDSIDLTKRAIMPVFISTSASGSSSFALKTWSLSVKATGSPGAPAQRTEIEDMGDGVGIRYLVFEDCGHLLLIVHQIDAVNCEKLRLIGMFVGPERIISVDWAVDDRCDPTKGSCCNGILGKKLIHDAPADQSGSAYDNSVILSHVSRVFGRAETIFPSIIQLCDTERNLNLVCFCASNVQWCITQAMRKCGIFTWSFYDGFGCARA